MTTTIKVWRSNTHVGRYDVAIGYATFSGCCMSALDILHLCRAIRAGKWWSLDKSSPIEIRRMSRNALTSVR